MKLRFVFLAVVATLALTLGADEPSTMPAAGAAAPVFTLPSQDGNAVALDAYRGKWVVLYFYPRDFTSGCTLEAHNFQRDLDKYTRKNAVILGVSVDPVDSHKGFCTKEGLNFKLLADTEHTVTTKYGSLMNHDGTIFAARNTFLIDPHGVIRKVYTKVSPAGHSDEILSDLATLQAAK
ncbi:MAG: peroxiredoxin [Acidobacteria bacterium]|nr:peroxiredoxin [Acidobacteriota bacterium]MBV9476647.1 peroxiredoxin [Acidobacteriota bacterium]